MVNIDKLQKSIDWSITQLQKPREERLAAIQQYVGTHYADNGSDRVVPVNMLEQAITIYTQQLAAKAPRCTFTAKIPRLRPFAYATEIALNQIPEEIGLDETLRDAVVEALFSFAIIKVGLAHAGREHLGSAVGEPFADLVSVDNYFCDMNSKNRKECQFEGNDYWFSLEDAKSMWGDKDGLKSDEYTISGSQGESTADSITGDEGGELYNEKIWLRDVWLPRTNQLVTYGIKSKKVFNIVDWDGPEGGPYHMLGFSKVPGNLLPLPPVALLKDLHVLANTIFRKLGRQVESKKTVTVFPGGNDDDVASYQKARDGDGISGNSKPESVSVGGIDQASLAMFIQCKDIFSYQAGNLDALGGLGPMSDTIGQDQMMKQSASARMSYMQDRTLDFARGVFKSLAWYEWTDPMRERQVEKKVKGTEFSVTSVWSHETRDGDWLDFNFDIDVHSMQSDSPEAKLQKIGAVLQQYIYPALPLLQQQGGQINFQELLALIAKLGNLPELEGLIQFTEPMEEQQEQGNSTPQVGMPNNTTRTYERVNRPGATRHGKDDVMSRILMGSGVQPSEGAALKRNIN